MAFGTIRPQIVTLLKTLSNVEDANIVGYPKTNFSGYPAAYVIPSDNESDYETTSENVRVYAFKVAFFYTTKQIGKEAALDRLEEIIDAALDLFDQEDQKGSDTRTVGMNLPSGYMFLNIFATPGLWGEVSDNDLVMAELNVRVRVSVDVS